MKSNPNDPEDIASLIQDIIELLYESSPNKKVKGIDICKYILITFKNKLHGYLPHKYVKKAWNIMKERLQNKEVGYFKRKMVELYYQIKQEQYEHKNSFQNYQINLDTELFILFENEFLSFDDMLF